MTGRTRIPAHRRRSQRSAIGWAVSLLAKDLRRELRGTATAGAGLREFARLVPGDSQLGRQLERMDELTAHDGHSYLNARQATMARRLRSRILVLVLLEQSRRRAGGVEAKGRGLWFGRSHARNRHGALTRPETRQGLCSRLRCCHKTVQRLWRRLEDADVGRAHQPQEAGGRAPEKLPEYMRGTDYAYLVWHWDAPIPPLAARAAFGERAKAPDPPGMAPRRAGPEGEALAAELLAQLELD